MRLWLGITILNAITHGQTVDYGDYDYDVALTGATVDLGPDNRKQSDYEKGAQSPYDRVKKISRQSRDWINQYADNYKKKPRLERAITRFQSRYQNALSADGCKKDPSYEQQRDFDGELSRKLPADPEAKIEKFSKLLNKFHRLYLTGCKKATRLEEVSDRFKRQFLGAYARMKNCKKCGDYGAGGKDDAGVFGADVEETTQMTETTAEPTTEATTTTAESMTEGTVTSTTSTFTVTSTTTTTQTTTKPTKRPKKNKQKKNKTEKKVDYNNPGDKFTKPFSG